MMNSPNLGIFIIIYDDAFVPYTLLYIGASQFYCCKFLP